MKKGILLTLFFCYSTMGFSQELNFTVTINSERARIQNTDVFSQMKTSFEQFLNGRSWTTDEFRPEERIKGNLLITINDVPQVGSYNATVQIQTVRPVYGTNYESLIFNFADRNWSFDYIESQPLEFNRFTYLNSISSLLAFYAHIALGLDYDSFESRGGDEFFAAANDIVNNAQQSGRQGWAQSSSDRRNRYALNNDIYTSSVFSVIRDAYYLYHRQGLDILQIRPEEAYANILEAIRILAEANKTQPNGIFTITFMDAKSDEIASVMKNASLEIRSEIVELLLEVDPNNARKYNELLKS
ncbi:DUF4835 family protein [Algoriphagus sp. Y33]|uniref:type IX secretion system protein PorD n=1 Tax=Algoriphagus sp. Y33 TaxID=2772483 RepID=UPI00177AA0F6|nr:DUF4835 family protein [Algoriphagus sp. Y33]